MRGGIVVDAPGVTIGRRNRFRRAEYQQPVRVSGDAVLTDNSYLDGGAPPAR